MVYKIPCKNCEKSYIGETKRRLDIRISEHKKETETQASLHAQFTRATRKASVTEIHKSAVSEHVVQENHVIDWDNVKIVDREQDRKTRWIKEAIAIRREGPGGVFNRDEGQYPLTSLYDHFLVRSRCTKPRLQ